MTPQPKVCMAAGTEWAALVGSVDSPTTATVSKSSSMRRVSALVSSTTSPCPGLARVAHACRRRSWEDDGALTVEQDPVLDVPSHGARERDAFEVTADCGQCIGRVRMADAGDLLFDDRSLVEVGCDVVGRRADQLHAMVVGLLVGAPATEARKERVVDVDDAASQRIADLRGQHLHVAGE